MKLCHSDIEIQFTINPDIINVLVLEDKDIFYEFSKEIHCQVFGEEGKFVLSEGNKELSINKECIVLCDFFNININDKKILSKIYANLLSLKEEKYIYEYSEIMQKLYALIDIINSECNYEIEYEQSENFISILKAINVKIVDNDKTLIEKIISYLHICAELLKVKCVFFINLKCYISVENLKKIYMEAAYLDLSLFLVESMETDIIENEEITIIDIDLCEIVVR